MKRFHFNLEKVLTFREGERDQVRTEFKAAMQKVHAVERELSELERERRETQRMLLTERGRPAMQVSRILTLERGLGLLLEAVKQAGRRLGEARTEAEEVRLRFQEAKRNCETLERLKEKQRRRHEKALQAEEMKRLDEVAVNRFMKQMGEYEDA
jgi:flagellar FliJ protein